MAAIFFGLIPLLAWRRLTKLVFCLGASSSQKLRTATVKLPKFIRDSDLNAPSFCDAYWSDIPFPMDIFGWWNLATDSPYEERYWLDVDCKFYTDTPILTPLCLSSTPWQIEIDGAEVILGNIDQMPGSFALP